MRRKESNQTNKQKQENLYLGVGEQQRSKPACTSAQTDQGLCYSVFGKYHILTCYKRNSDFLASLCSLGGWFESHFLDNPEDRFSCLAPLVMSTMS